MVGSGGKAGGGAHWQDARTRRRHSTGPLMAPIHQAPSLPTHPSPCLSSLAPYPPLPAPSCLSLLERVLWLLHPARLCLCPIPSPCHSSLPAYPLLPIPSLPQRAFTCPVAAAPSTPRPAPPSFPFPPHPLPLHPHPPILSFPSLLPIIASPALWLLRPARLYQHPHPFHFLTTPFLSTPPSYPFLPIPSCPSLPPTCPVAAAPSTPLLAAAGPCSPEAAQAATRACARTETGTPWKRRGWGVS